MGWGTRVHYRGADRRQGEDETIVARRYAGLSWLAVALLVLATATLASLLAVERLPGGLRVPLLAAGLAAGVLLAVVNVLHWRSTGRVRGCRIATATWALLAVLGLDVGARIGLAPPPAARQVLLTVALVWLLWATIGPTVDTRVRPVRDLAVAVAGIGLGFGGVAVWHLLGPRLGEPVLGHLVLGGVSLALVALIVWRRRQGDLVLLDVALLLALTVAGAELAHAAGTLTPRGWPRLADALPLLGLMAAAIGTAGWLSVGLTAKRADLHAAQLVQQGRSREEQRRSREEGHEIRNAVLAIEGVALLLDGHRDLLDAQERQLLSQGLADRLEQLRGLVAPRPTAPAPLALWELVARQAAIARAQGMPAALQGEADVVVLADGDLVLQIVDNLLANARRHGQGARRGVLLTVSREEGRGVLRVRDRGSGIPTDRREVVFEAGVQGATSDGEGLGLHLARALARDQGGDLVVEEPRGRGACFALSLPLAPRTRGGSRVVDGTENGRKVGQRDGGAVGRAGDAAAGGARAVVEHDEELRGGRLEVRRDDGHIEAGIGGRPEEDRDPSMGGQQ